MAIFQKDKKTSAEPAEFVGSVSLCYAAPCSPSADVYIEMCSSLSAGCGTPSDGHPAVTVTAATKYNIKI